MDVQLIFFVLHMWCSDSLSWYDRHQNFAAFLHIFPEKQNKKNVDQVIFEGF